MYFFFIHFRVLWIYKSNRHHPYLTLSYEYSHAWLRPSLMISNAESGLPPVQALASTTQLPSWFLWYHIEHWEWAQEGSNLHNSVYMIVITSTNIRKNLDSLFGDPNKWWGSSKPLDQWQSGCYIWPSDNITNNIIAGIAQHTRGDSVSW